MSNDDDFIIQVITCGAIDFLMDGRGLTYDDLMTEMQAYEYRIETFEEHERI